MSVSLYYTAKRIQPITKQEQTACETIAERYDFQYPYGELYEGFCIYNLEQYPYITEDESNVIFAGATALPPIFDMELLQNIINWWLECLSEITDILYDAQWDVSIDDNPIKWSANTN